MPTRILVKTTIGPVADDWNVGRFSLLTDHLRSLKDSSGRALFGVVARDRSENQQGDDTDLVQLANGAYDQLWLIGADVEAEFCSLAITRTLAPVSHDLGRSGQRSTFKRLILIPMSPVAAAMTSK